MELISYNGLAFEPYITAKQISERIQEIAKELNKEYYGKSPMFVCVLNGAFPFAADLFRAVDLDAEICFIRLKSYEGTSTTGVIKEVIGLSESIESRDVIVIEDIVDTGFTIKKLVDDLKNKKPASLKVATLLFKTESLKTDINPDYIGFAIPPKFIIGFGLDIYGKALNLRDIYVLHEE